MKGRIYPQKSQALNEADRLEIARLLIKAGYAVAIVQEKDGKQRTVNVIEYWEVGK